ncbi:MAG TPA: peptidylprolyl isomerase [Verrucomicrobiae bacterium]|nr:peptidylprolyl isomerase [Verrucomicrobiae bacterium]
MKSYALLCAAALLSGIAGLSAAEDTNTAAANIPAQSTQQSAGSDSSFASPERLKEKAPESFKAKFDTSEGVFVVEVTRALSPNGADRFYNLVRSGYFTDVQFFRVIKGFMCQFGMHGDPKVSAAWRSARIQDDPVKGSNKRGTVSFAMAGPNTRTTQLFINYVDNTRLDDMGFSPFGTVIEGMDVVDKINGEYGEGAPQGRGPSQGRIQAEGNAYLKKDFPNLDYIKSATIVP